VFISPLRCTKRTKKKNPFKTEYFASPPPLILNHIGSSFVTFHLNFFELAFSGVGVRRGCVQICDAERLGKIPNGFPARVDSQRFQRRVRRDPVHSQRQKAPGEQFKLAAVDVQ